MEDAIAPDPETGIPHYPERNWENGLPVHSMIDSALRHLAKYVDGWTDEDHLCAAATNLLMAMWTEEKKPTMQDIPSRLKEAPSLASGTEGGTPVPPDSSAQEKALPVARRKCDCYDSVFGQCLGAKEREKCYCGGDRNKCDFYGG